MDVFVARHPIFDRQKVVRGYDVVFREGFEAFYESVLSDRARVEFRMAMDFDEIAGHGRALLMFPRELLLKGVASLFPADRLTVGIPSALKADAEVCDACAQLKAAGFELAVDGVGPGEADLPVVALADIARVDTAALGREEQQAVFEALAGRGTALLARHVETPEAFDAAAELGYRYFEGGFFRKPLLGPGRELPTDQLSYLRVLEQVNRPELAYDELEELIQRDVAMTYRLLRFINSAWYGLKHEVKSVRHALVLLGPTEVRAWASLLVLRDLGREKPRELFRCCLLRARAGEKLAAAAGLGERASECFLMGMFSFLDALTDLPMEKALANLPVSDAIKSALLGTGGRLGILFDTLVSYELGQWDTLSQCAEALELDEQAIPALFREAEKWADAALEAM